jgi:copper(I)-binding protein
MSIEAREADSLISVSSPVAKSTELHRTSFEDGIAQMRKVDSVIITPKAPLSLESGGLHLMLMGLTEPLQAGQSFEVTLSFQQAGEITAAVEVVAPNAEPAHH